MKRLLFTLACATAIFTSHPAFAGSGLPDTDSLMHFRFDGTDREYRLAIPDSLDESRPLVIMMHGYGGKADPDRFGMKQAALKHGFAICFPQGERDTTGKTGWNIGYPAQKGMKTDDVEFISSLAEHIVSEYNLNPDNVFCSGYSNGGDLCYLIADRKPDEFAALASISGLTMKWVLNSYESTKQIPFIEFHGTADKTSRWGGDPDNTGGWGEYILHKNKEYINRKGPTDERRNMIMDFPKGSDEFIGYLNSIKLRELEQNPLYYPSGRIYIYPESFYKKHPDWY